MNGPSNWDLNLCFSWFAITTCLSCNDMCHGKDGARWWSPPLLILPAVHGFLIVLTAWLQSRTNWGYYRLIGVDFLAVPLAMCCGDPSGLLFGIFLVIGTTWWYFIGRIGWESKQGRIGRVTAGLAALLALLFALVGTVGSAVIFRHDFRDRALSAAIGLQYVCAGILCMGAFVSTFYSVRAVFAGRHEKDLIDE